MSSADKAVIGGRTYRAYLARRCCEGCAAYDKETRERNRALCDALPPCSGTQRRGGGVIWVTKAGERRVNAPHRTEAQACT